MEVHGSGEGEITALRERRDHQAWEAPQVLINVLEAGTGLTQKASVRAFVPVVAQVSGGRGRSCIAFLMALGAYTYVYT